MAKRIVSFKKIGDNLEVFLDIASSNKEKNKLVQCIYRVLSYYDIDFPITRKNQSTLIVNGLGNVDYWESVRDDIYDEFVDWYSNESIE